MGENLDLDDRLAVRTPMQWTAAPSAGFSTAPPDALCRALPTGDRFGPAAINVQDQRTDPESLLNWFERLIRLRKESPEIGWGTARVVDAGAPSVLALRYDWDGKSLLTVHNLAAKAVTCRLDVDGMGTGALRDGLRPGPAVAIRDGNVSVKLAGHDYRWLRSDAP